MLLLIKGAFDGFSVNLLRLTTGKEILLFKLKGAAGSELVFARTVNAIPGRTLPAEDGLSGSLVLRFGGVSFGKSGISSGRTGALGRGLGELAREEGAEFRPLVVGARPLEVKLLVTGTRPTEGERPVLIGWRVGVDDRELARATEELVFVLEPEVIWEREVGVDGREFWAELVLLKVGVTLVREVGVDGREFWVELVLFETGVIRGREVGVEGRELWADAGFVSWEVDGGRALMGVDERAGTGRAAGADGFGVVRVGGVLRLGVKGLEVIEDVLVLRIDVLLLLLEAKVAEMDEMEGRETEELRIGLEELTGSG